LLGLCACEGYNPGVGDEDGADSDSD